MTERRSPKDIRRSILHDAFRAGITLKGIDGILEIIGGVLLWLVNPASMNLFVQTLLQHELSRDPDDFFALHLLRATQHFTGESKTFAALYLLSHGVVKIVLVAALWLDELWAYPISILVFTVFGVYQLYRYHHTHSFWLIVLTVFDAVVIYLTAREYSAQKSLRAARARITVG